jgi:hypothetical protein
MPNRSVKSMQAFYTKINEDIKNLGIEYPAADATPVKEAPPSSGKKRGRGKFLDNSMFSITEQKTHMYHQLQPRRRKSSPRAMQ